MRGRLEIAAQLSKVSAAFGRILMQRVSPVKFLLWDEPISAGRLKSDRLQSRTPIARLGTAVRTITSLLSPAFLRPNPNRAFRCSSARTRTARSHSSPGSRHPSPALSRRLPPAAASSRLTTPQPPGPRFGARTHQPTWPGKGYPLDTRRRGGAYGVPGEVWSRSPCGGLQPGGRCRRAPSRTAQGDRWRDP